MPRRPPARIVRTEKAKFAKRRSVGIGPSAAWTAAEKSISKSSNRGTGMKALLVSLTVTGCVLLIWGAALLFAAAVLSGDSQLQATLSQYATVWQWFTAA